MIRPFWEKLIHWDASFGIALIFLFGIPRFIIVLAANQTGDYRFVSIIFVIMWLAPFVWLTREGRRSIGIKKPTHYSGLLFSFLAGAAACAVMFIVAEFYAGHSISNWFVYISRSYSAGDALRRATGSEKQIYFLISTFFTMTFSPIGEEFLYRGIIQGSLAASLGERRASIIDSTAFALTHLAHFGIVFAAGAWTFLFLPGLLWVLFMFGASFLFIYCKIKTGSLLGAISCHAGFNAAMTYFIFYYILV